jgi:hypothetical protein
MEEFRPLVFVAMPFGLKWDQTRTHQIDFDRIYEAGIRPAVARLPLEIIRADEERSGGIIHLPMYERLLLAEIAIVDATTQNANVFYELGVRHAARPASTIIVSTIDGPLPFDIAMIRTVPYTLVDGVLTDENAAAFADALEARLKTALADLNNVQDSPLFQLIPKFPGIELPHDACEGFRDRARYVDAVRDRLAAAVALDKTAAAAQIRAIEDELSKGSPANAELTMDLVLAYRGLDTQDGWAGIVRLVENLPEPVRESSVTIREQYALALNRLYTFNKGDERRRAIEILTSIVATQGDSPETCALIGRIYKDQYSEAIAAGQNLKARNGDRVVWSRVQCGPPRLFSGRQPRDVARDPKYRRIESRTAPRRPGNFICRRAPGRDEVGGLLASGNRARTRRARHRVGRRATRARSHPRDQERSDAVQYDRRESRAVPEALHGRRRGQGR